MLLLLLGVAIVAGLGRQLALGRRDSGKRRAPVAVFGGTKIKVGPERFVDEEVTAIFGGITLDLREAHIDEVASVTAFAMFGGVQILVPTGWRVSIGGIAIFGGYDDRTTGGHAALPPDAPVLKVNVTAVFGGVAVSADPD